MGKSLLSLVLVLLLANIAYAQTSETVTITTYYPAPYGEYRQIKLTPTPSLGTTCSNPGAVYYNSSDNVIYYCNAATSQWQPIAGTLRLRNCARRTITRRELDFYWMMCPAGKVMQGFTGRVKDDNMAGFGVDCCEPYIAY